MEPSSPRYLHRTFAPKENPAAKNGTSFPTLFRICSATILRSSGKKPILGDLDFCVVVIIFFGVGRWRGVVEGTNGQLLPASSVIHNGATNSIFSAALDEKLDLEGFRTSRDTWEHEEDRGLSFVLFYLFGESVFYILWDFIDRIDCLLDRGVRGRGIIIFRKMRQMRLGPAGGGRGRGIGTGTRIGNHRMRFEVNPIKVYGPPVRKPNVLSTD